MRPFLILLLTALFAVPAAAQYPTPTINSGDALPPASSNGTTPPAAPINSSGGAFQSTSPAAAPLAAAAPQPAKEEVGYDAKVKRDPYGNVLKDSTKTSQQRTEAPALRNDKKLGGDSSLLKH